MPTEQTTADWSTSYSRYLMESAAVSARTLKLYQEALDQVARGKLAPTIFQDRLSHFSQAHSAELSLQLAEAGGRFMTDLMRMGAGFGQRAGLRGEDDDELTPPVFDSKNPARWYEQLAHYAGQLNARALEAYRTQLDRVASGQMTPHEVQQTASEQLSQRVPEYLQRMTQIYFDLLSNLNDVRARYEETYYREVLAQAGHSEADGPLTLRLFGVRGTAVSASLAVTNTTTKPASITYRVTELRRADGVGPAFAPKVTVVPQPFELPPGADITVSFAVQLDADTYEPDVAYVGSFHILGGTELNVVVQLRIIATGPAANHADPGNGQ